MPTKISPDPTIAPEFYGFVQNPAERLITQYREIAQQQMQEIPFLHPTMSISATLQEFDAQWFGCVLTPWMLSLVILPGPQQIWSRRNMGERIGLQLPHGNMTFIVGELPHIGQLLSCSLMSPIDRQLTCQQGETLMRDTVKIALSLPLRKQEDNGIELSRRALLTRFS